MGAQRARGRRGPGRLPPAVMTERPLCSTHGLQAPGSGLCQWLGKKKAFLQVGAGASSCLTMGGIDRLGEVPPLSPPPPPSALFPVSSGQDQAACNWIHTQWGPRRLPQAPGVWPCPSPSTEDVFLGSARHQEPAVPPHEWQGQQPWLRPEFPPGGGSLFALSQLVWDFWLLATDGGPEWPFCIRPAQAAATDKSRQGHRCLLGCRAGGSPVAEKHADPGSPNHPSPLWGHPAHAVGRRGDSEDQRAGI